MSFRWKLCLLAGLAMTSGCKRKEAADEPPVTTAPKVGADRSAPSATMPAPAPTGVATIELSRQVSGLADLAGITVGEPGFKGEMPSCCLDCDPLVAPLRRVEALLPTLSGTVGPAPLRAAATQVRGVGWAELIEDTYDAKARQAFVASLGGLADALDATAAALEANDASVSARATDLAGAVTTLLAAAAVIGEESQHYCGND